LIKIYNCIKNIDLLEEEQQEGNFKELILKVKAFHRNALYRFYLKPNEKKLLKEL
jgi:hypothetical protein